MEKYDNLGLVGEGSYGMVMKCRNRETGQVVAIKKFLDSEEDKLVKKIAAREIRMLKQLRHDNLVNLLEVFRRKKRLYLVFEFVDHTVLEDLENNPKGIDETTTKKILFQVVRGIEFCHVHNIIHRDIKPENILVSRSGIVKLCDFGFARVLAAPGEVYTDYVATRWYRAPELLVGDTKYGRAVDIWAIGCLAAEMLTGDPLFPGDSDIDQLHHVVRCLGNLNEKYEHIFQRNPLFAGMRLPVARELVPLERRLPKVAKLTMGFIKSCLRLDANDRPTSSALLRSEYFTRDSFSSKFLDELKYLIRCEAEQLGATVFRTALSIGRQKASPKALPNKIAAKDSTSNLTSNISTITKTDTATTTTTTNIDKTSNTTPVNTIANTTIITTGKTTTNKTTNTAVVIATTPTTTTAPITSEPKKKAAAHLKVVPEKPEHVTREVRKEKKPKECPKQTPMVVVKPAIKVEQRGEKKLPSPSPEVCPDERNSPKATSPDQLTPRFLPTHPILDLRLSAELNDTHRSCSSSEQETLRSQCVDTPAEYKSMLSNESVSFYSTGKFNSVKQDDGVKHHDASRSDNTSGLKSVQVSDRSNRKTLTESAQVSIPIEHCQPDRSYIMPNIPQRSTGFLTTTEDPCTSKPANTLCLKTGDSIRGQQAGSSMEPSTLYSPVPSHHDFKQNKQGMQLYSQLTNRSVTSDDSFAVELTSKHALPIHHFQMANTSTLVPSASQSPSLLDQMHSASLAKFYASEDHSHPDDQTAGSVDANLSSLPQLPTLLHESNESNTRSVGPGSYHRIETQPIVTSSQTDSCSGNRVPFGNYTETTQSGKTNPFPHELRPLPLPSGISLGGMSSPHNSPYLWDSKKKRTPAMGLYKKHSLTPSTSVSSGYCTTQTPSNLTMLPEHSGIAFAGSVSGSALLDTHHETVQTRENTDYGHHPSRLGSLGTVTYGVGGVVGRSPLLTLTQQNMMRQRTHQIPPNHSVNKYDNLGPTHMFGPQILPINTTVSGITGVSGSLNVSSSLAGRGLHSNQLSFPGVRTSDKFWLGNLPRR